MRTITLLSGCACYLLSLLLLCPPALAGPQDRSPEKPNTNEAPGPCAVFRDTKDTITIDARCWSGTLTQAVPPGGTVSLKILNKNPFLYTYRITLNETLVQEPPIGAFLAQISGLFAASTAAVKAAAGPAVTLSAEAEELVHGKVRAPKECTAEAQVAFGDLIETLATLRGTSNGVDALNAQLADLRTEYEILRRSYDGARREALSPWALDVNLRRVQRELVDLHASHAALTVTAQRVAALRDVVDGRAKALMGRVDQFRKDHPTCAIAGTATIRALAENVAVDITGATAELALITPALAVIAASIEAASRLTVNDFSEVRTLQMPTDARDITFTLQRTSGQSATTTDKPGEKPVPSVQGPGEQIAQRVLQVGGGPRFLLSGGVAYARGIPNRKFQIVHGLERSRTGETTGTELTSVVGYQENQNRAILPVLLWNTRVISPLFISMGITAKVGDDALTIDYVVGPSVGFLSNRLLATIGWYYGRRPVLAGDLYVGAKLAAGADIPVENRYHSGVGFVLSFKIR